MPKQIKKKAAKKRLYNRKSRPQTITNVDSTDVEFLKPTSKGKDTEVDSLSIICSIFDHWTDDQKRRNLTYLCGKYYDFM